MQIFVSKIFLPFHGYKTLREPNLVKWVGFSSVLLRNAIKSKSLPKKHKAGLGIVQIGFIFFHFIENFLNF